jgi:glycosyltransferase involved in cell wall biosynthesis
MLTSRFPGCSQSTAIHAVPLRRHGSWWNANFALFAAARRELARRPYDVVVEDINKIPFFTPLVHDVPTVVVVPHLFGGTVYRETNPLFATYVWLMERPMPWVYRRARWIAISASTKRDLVLRGIPPSRVDVVHCGLDFERYDLAEPPPRQPRPTLVHLGRLMRYKCADVALRALVHVRRQVEARLLVLGDGPDRGRLERLAARLGLTGAVEFRGHVGHDEKVRLLWESHVLLNPSPKEGWGLTVVEANACGVPVVASRSPGLMDSVRHGETGLLVPHGQPRAMADAVLQLLQDRALHERLAAGGRAWARSLRWEDAVLQTERILQEAGGAAGS